MESLHCSLGSGKESCTECPFKLDVPKLFVPEHDNLVLPWASFVKPIPYPTESKGCQCVRHGMFPLFRNSNCLNDMHACIERLLI